MLLIQIQNTFPPRLHIKSVFQCPKTAELGLEHTNIHHLIATGLFFLCMIIFMTCGRLTECHQAGRCLLSCRVWSRSFLPCVLRADRDQQYTSRAPTPAEGQNTSTTLQKNTHTLVLQYVTVTHRLFRRDGECEPNTHTHTPGAGQLPSGCTHSRPVDMQDSRELSC